MDFRHADNPEPFYKHKKKLQAEKRELPSNNVVIPAYRMLKKGDIIKENDEFLEDDCVTWTKFDKSYGVGSKYDLNLYVPARRRVAEKRELPVDNFVSAVHIPKFKDMSRETQDAIIALVATVEKKYYEKGLNISKTAKEIFEAAQWDMIRGVRYLDEKECIALIEKLRSKYE